MNMLKMNDTSTGGRLAKGHIKIGTETEEDDCHDTNAVLLPEVNFNARDEFNLKFFDNADDNCFSDPESVESCEASTSSPTDADPCAPIDDIESPVDWMDSLMQTIDSNEGSFEKHKAKIAGDLRLTQNNNNEGEELENVLTGVDDRQSQLFNNVIKIGRCFIETLKMCVYFLRERVVYL